MEENGRGAAPQPQTQQQTQVQFKCTGNCLGCSPAQRAYCASQHAYSNMKVLDAVMQEVLTLHESVKALSEKVEAIKPTEEPVYGIRSIAQEGAGA